MILQLKYVLDSEKAILRHSARRNGMPIDDSILTETREVGLTKDRIRKNHRKLQIINHPDRGGSPYLATKVNEAAEFLNKNS